MTDVTGVLDAIDSALADNSVSRDAMRSSRQRVICDGGRPLIPVRYNPWLHGTTRFQVSRMPPVSEAATRALRSAFVSVSIDIRPFIAEMERLGQVLARTLAPFSASLARMGSVLLHDLDRADRPAWHQRRCPKCHPSGFSTPPSGQFGNYYNQRRKARRRRGRR